MVHTPATPSAPPQARRTKKPEDSPAGPAFWDIKAEAKSKGKQPIETPPVVDTPQMASSRKGKAKRVMVEPMPLVTPVSRTKSTRNASSSDVQQNDTPLRADGTMQPPRKRRRTGDAHPESTSRHTLRSAATMPDLSSPQTPISALVSRIPNNHALHAQATEPSISPIKHPIPRVKLLVRRPPPMYSHPLQKPPPQQHGGSLDTLLASFTYRNSAEIAPETLAAELSAELALWKKIDALRQHGRLIERCEYQFGGAPPGDAWAAIVAQVERPGPKFVDGREMAANVAGKVRKYWEMENKVEEVRLKGLAKKAMRMVVEQWKKAVFVSAVVYACSSNMELGLMIFAPTARARAGTVGVGGGGAEEGSGALGRDSGPVRADLGGAAAGPSAGVAESVTQHLDVRTR